MSDANLRLHTTFPALSHTQLILALKCRLFTRSNIPMIQFIPFVLKKARLLLVYMAKVNDKQEHVPSFEIPGLYDKKKDI